ncbi:MAG: TIGR03960 family B12-binding radical SAM protein [Planctomycetota bacterium]
MSRYFEQLKALLPDVKMPAQYIGGEWNQVVKDPAAVTLRVALIYPDAYEVGMSHYGLKILYHILNLNEHWAAERSYTPFPDLGAKLTERGIPLLSLETHTPVKQFDVVGFTLQSEMTLSNVLYTLDLAQIPLHTEQRGEHDPLVMCGGAGAYSPEVLAPFIDLFFIGDGEEGFPQVLAHYEELKRGGAGRAERIELLARRFPFLYAPALYDVSYHADGTLRAHTPRVAGLHAVTKGTYVMNLDAVPYPTKLILPHTRTVHDRIALEVMRGCVHGCRFCQAGMITRPWRVRSPEKLVQLAKESYAATGLDEISLLSLSTSDYPFLEEVVTRLHQEFQGKNVNVSLPSLRVNQQLRYLPKLVKGVRKSGLTMAPEVATDRLRRRVNKPIKNEDLIEGARAAFKDGWDHVKLYCMIGVPGENDDDVRGIVELAEEVSRLGRETRRRCARVNVTISTHVPKPFTPYQWDGMLGVADVRARQCFLKGMRPLKSVRLKFHDPEQSMIEGLLTRGDRRVGAMLEAAYRRGARFDSWDEHFALRPWLEACEATGVDPSFYAHRERPIAERLPWDHIDAGPSREYLADECARARAEVPADNCFGHRCNACGVKVKDCFTEKKWQKSLVPTITTRLGPVVHEPYAYK